MAFYQGFTLDTLLGCVSCILGFVALFLGTKAYKKCRVFESSLNDRKVFKDDSSDHSQRAAGNIVNNNCDVNALTSLTTANFEASLKQAYSVFDQQAKKNLQKIITQTKQIIQEQKPNIAGLSKIDWINIYFEAAKNTSDAYMQKIWAKVLAKELECPGSFSYKTLDVLKNMSSDEFNCFEKLCSLEINGWILQKDIHSKYGLSYVDLVRLSEFGLLNMGQAQNSMTIQAHTSGSLRYKGLLLLIENPTDDEITISFEIFLLSSVAKELLVVSNATVIEEYAKECVKALSEQNKSVKITLHKINNISVNQIYYQKEDLCSKE